MTFLTELKSLSCLGTKPSGRQEAGHADISDETKHAELDVDILPPLRPITFPMILPLHQPAFAEQGWTTVTYSDSDPLYTTSNTLLAASKAFFDRPAEYKECFKTSGGSDEGWSRVDGEKEFVTLRSTDTLPDELRDAVTAFWTEAGGLLDVILGRVAISLGLPAEMLTAYSSPCKLMKDKRTQTMMRLFRYEGFGGARSKIVAEGHRDLGLLSLVIGDQPGLEVWDRTIQKWFQIERTYQKPSASLLVGRELEIMSNGRYVPGGHLVRSYPASTEPSQKYRYSIVFALRAHGPVFVDTDRLTTSITGEFRKPTKHMTAEDMFKGIYKSYYNINTSVEERKEQKERLLREKRNKELQK